MTGTTVRLTAGIAIMVAGLVAVAFMQINAATQIDEADRLGTGGNLFDVGILPLGLLGVILVFAGVAVTAVGLHRRANPR